MAYTPLTSSWYDVGRAITRRLFNTVKLNQDDFDSRLGGVEEAAGKIAIWSETVVLSCNATSLLGLDYWEAPFDINVSGATVGVFDVSGKGISGTLEIDIKTASSRNPSSMNSIFSTRPSISTWSTNYLDSSNAVINSLGELTQGDSLRFDVTSLPTGGSGFLGAFFINIVGEV